MSEPLHVVFVAAEAVPFAKVGGLADVAGALPRELEALGVRVTLVLPGYGAMDRTRHAVSRVALPGDPSVQMGTRREPLGLERAQLPESGVEVLFVRHAGYFGRDGIYTDPRSHREFQDAAERFIYFSRAVLAALEALEYRPDVVHLHDYHPALVAAYLRAPEVSSQRLLLETALVLSVHNLGYQGIFPPAAFALTGLPARYMEPLGPLEFWGRMNLMKGGLVLSDLLTTVSPTYARQIQESEEFGFGLQDVLRARGGDLLGILNGIDTRVWNPASDRLLPQTYDVERLEGKAACKRALQERLRLPPGPEVPLFGIISRLADQKGLDLVLQAAPELLAAGLQLVVLGSGQREYEVALQELARAHPRALAVQFAFDDALAHWIEAGCDFFLMPSRYEPCGLNQMYSLNYGTVPVVRRTGGLADTVTEWNPRTGEGNGFLFEPYRAEALVAAVRRALHAHGDAATMRRLRHAGMRADFSWRASARRYLEAYERAVVLRRGSARRTAG